MIKKVIRFFKRKQQYRVNTADNILYHILETSMTQDLL
jgi:RIO-like serine/threonine protein kinase